ncbi:nucleotidyltransferase family protein [Gloeocapsa sp. PCC 73106]|uniref:nucleotidyltransferase family protein n=1 Tax=Gloeocapsa sp. PCC 73106 TaxID=102232 RepID=UPI0002AC6F9D|nr:nucleotidyltransferase domain-containing protein [Gloeocapsa sp. PCC 73106]ELR99353.1 putative nucleotidyltransferase [Gloeocapsa sp. PCC 73106]
MKYQEVITILKDHQSELNNKGVLHAGVFGSVARGEANVHSDIDLLIDLDENKIPDLFAYANLLSYIQDLFANSQVDIANRATLKPHVRPSTEKDYLNAF